MNREEALRWCVAELESWPQFAEHSEGPDDWGWVVTLGERTPRLVRLNTNDASIREEDWLAAKRTATRDEALAWCVENVTEWPAADSDQPQQLPINGWAWSKIAVIGYALVAHANTLIGLNDWLAAKRAATPTVTAPSILSQAAAAIGDRAAERDQPDGERSMARTVAAFNAMFGQALTEEQGWQFMELLKMARSAGGDFRLDDYLDGAAYAALAGEAAAR